MVDKQLDKMRLCKHDMDLDGTLQFINKFGWKRQSEKIRAKTISTPAKLPEDKAFEDMMVPMDGDYVISVSRKARHRCLHRVGSCFRVPGRHYTDFILSGVEMPSDDTYDAICQGCWRSEVNDLPIEDTHAETSSSSED